MSEERNTKSLLLSGRLCSVITHRANFQKCWTRLMGQSPLADICTFGHETRFSQTRGWYPGCWAALKMWLFTAPGWCTGMNYKTHMPVKKLGPLRSGSCLGYSYTQLGWVSNSKCFCLRENLKLANPQVPDEEFSHQPQVRPNVPAA